MTSKHGENVLDLASIRAKLESDAAGRFWRGLEELAETEEYKAFRDREFAVDATDEPGGVSRRNLLKLMGASAALAGILLLAAFVTSSTYFSAERQARNAVSKMFELEHDWVSTTLGHEVRSLDTITPRAHPVRRREKKTGKATLPVPPVHRTR